MLKQVDIKQALDLVLDVEEKNNILSCLSPPSCFKWNVSQMVLVILICNCFVTPVHSLSSTGGPRAKSGTANLPIQCATEFQNSEAQKVNILCSLLLKQLKLQCYTCILSLSLAWYRDCQLLLIYFPLKNLLLELLAQQSASSTQLKPHFTTVEAKLFPDISTM